MKLINIPGLCAIPRIYDAAVNLLTAEKEDTSKQDMQIAALKEQVSTLLKGIDKTPTTETLPNPEPDPKAMDKLLRDLEENYNSPVERRKNSPIEKETINTDWVYKGTDPNLVKPVKPIFKTPTKPQAPSKIGKGTLEQRLAKSMNLNREIMPNSTKESTKKIEKDDRPAIDALGRKKRKKNYTIDRTPFTKAEWDQTHFRDTQRKTWNALHPGGPVRTKEAMYPLLNAEFQMNKSRTFYSTVLIAGRDSHKSRDMCPDAPVERKYHSDAAQYVTNFADIKKLYEE